MNDDFLATRADAVVWGVAYLPRNSSYLVSRTGEEALI